jgi:hypothetical protein
VKRLYSAAVAIALSTVPAVAHACPVCFTGTEENRAAYFLTFVLLTSLPLACIGGLVWWVRKRFREAEA